MKASTKSQYVVDAKGQKQAVLLDMEQYQQMLEDLHDLRVVAERKSEQKFSFPVFGAIPLSKRKFPGTPLLARENFLEPPS